MESSVPEIQQTQGMIIADGFSSEQEEYTKKLLDDQQLIQEIIDSKVKEQVKYILPPPQEIKSKMYSLLPDKVNGWGLRKDQPNPIPITFGNKYLDSLITSMLTNPRKKSKVVYLGPRYQSTFYAWRDKPFDFPYSHINMPKNIKYKKRPFLGQNPQIEDAVYFDSMFESGNLDLAVQVDSHEYDLFLRVDSNTRGHFNWFNFTIKNMKVSQKYRLNICNLQRGFCLYSRGMKPYMKSLKKKNDIWRQAGQNVTYTRKEIRFARQYDFEPRKAFALSFEIQTVQNNDQIQVAYCVPYTFSDNQRLVENLKITCQKRKNILKQTNLCSSLGGLPVHLLTITQPQKDEQVLKRRKCVIICGRAHPGQSNGSFMMQGFLKFVCGQSKPAQILRKYIVFKVVPMINPDGVALGNYRTGLSGRDFNRQYRNPDKDIFPEVYFFKKLVTESKIHFKNNLFMFLDLHGHSQKKNVFAYGPQFPIIDRFYYESRIFAKMLQKQNNRFRYHSCIFKISQCKLSTARAILMKKINIPLTYTIQASNGFFHDKQLLTSIPFSTSEWLKMGNSIGAAIYQYVQNMLLGQKIKKDRQKAKQESIRVKQDKQKTKSSVQSPEKKKHSAHQLIATRQDQKIKKIYDEILKQQNQKPGQPNSDDNISEGSSDKQDDKDDLSKKQLESLFISIKNNNKLGKNKSRRGKSSQFQIFQNDDEENDVGNKQTQIQDIKRSFRIKKSVEMPIIKNYDTVVIDQVFIANDRSFFNCHKKDILSPPKYINQRKQPNTKHLSIPQSLTKIVNYKFEEEKKKSELFQTISIFPNFGSKNKSTITISQCGHSPQKSCRSIVISNMSNTPRSIRFDKNSDFQKTLDVFGIRRKNALHQKLDELHLDNFKNSYSKFTKTHFYHQKRQMKNTSISFAKRLSERKNHLQ